MFIFFLVFSVTSKNKGEKYKNVGKKEQSSRNEIFKYSSFQVCKCYIIGKYTNRLIGYLQGLTEDEGSF